MSRVLITTFGVLHDAAPEGDALSVDLRKALRNPHHDPNMRYLTGLDAAVYEHVLATPGADQVVIETVSRVLNYFYSYAKPRGRDVLLHVFCQGGRHRSVAIAIAVAERLRELGLTVELVHRDVDKPVVQKIPASEDSATASVADAEAVTE